MNWTKTSSRRKRVQALPLAPLLLTLWAVSSPGVAESPDWSQWRGPQGTGIAPAGNPPVRWSETENVKWKVSVDGLGTSTPIVFGERVYLTTAIDTGAAGDGEFNVHQWVLIALDRASGKEVWRSVAWEGSPHAGTHPDGTWASGSPFTDGELVYAFFGSYGLHAFDFDGNRRWQRDFGDMRTRMSFGEGATPALHGDRIVVPWDQEDQSVIYAVDASTGEILWQQDRDEPTAWSTPLIVEHGGRVQVITNATNKVRSYDLADGKLLWEASGMTLNVIPTPVYADGVVYVASGFRGNALMAIRLDGASGDITGGENVLWSHDRDTPYVPSPLLSENRLYFFKSNNPILTVLNAETGEAIYGPQRVEGLTNVYASPVAAAGRIYLLGRKGGTVVLEDSDSYEVLATNRLDDDFDASPVIAGDEIFLRGRNALYCIGE